MIVAASAAAATGAFLPWQRFGSVAPALFDLGSLVALPILLLAVAVVATALALAFPLLVKRIALGAAASVALVEAGVMAAVWAAPPPLVQAHRAPSATSFTGLDVGWWVAASPPRPWRWRRCASGVRRSRPAPSPGRSAPADLRSVYPGSSGEAPASHQTELDAVSSVVIGSLDEGLAASARPVGAAHAGPAAGWVDDAGERLPHVDAVIAGHGEALATGAAIPFVHRRTTLPRRVGGRRLGRRHIGWYRAAPSASARRPAPA